MVIKNAESIGKALSSAVTKSPESCIGSIATFDSVEPLEAMEPAETYSICTPPKNAVQKILGEEAGPFRLSRTQMLERKMEREERQEAQVEKKTASVGVQTHVSFPERMIGIWTCRCPEADTVVDAPSIEEMDIPGATRPVDAAALKSPPPGLEFAKGMSKRDEREESTEVPTGADTHESVHDRSTAPTDGVRWGNKEDVDEMERQHREQFLREMFGGRFIDSCESTEKQDDSLLRFDELEKSIEAIEDEDGSGDEEECIHGLADSESEPGDEDDRREPPEEDEWIEPTVKGMVEM